MKTEESIKEYGWKSGNPDPVHSYILPAIIDLLPNKRELSVLDAGCGNGFVAGKLTELGHRVIGIDQAKDGIAIARTTFPEVRFEVFSVYDDFKKLIDSVDIVLSSEVIEHLYYPKEFIRNSFEVVQPGGYIILTTPYHGYLKNLALSITNNWDKHFTVAWEGGHIKFFSEKTLKRLLEDEGFKNIVFKNAGRLPGLWKSMVCRAQKPFL